MDIDRPTPLLGGLTPATFVRRHWQRRPLVVREAFLPALIGLDRKRLLALAAQDGVESRLVERRRGRWYLRSGPLARRSLPSLAMPGWSVLVQGVDLHDDATRRLLDRFRFLGDARLDDVMVSFATDGGGVGPHVDSYDVFLLQLAGRRRWRVGPVDAAKARMRDRSPLPVLEGFAPRDEWLLGEGDMLYLPPGIGHDGIAVGECVTASIGFRAPRQGELAARLAERVAESANDGEPLSASRVDRRYRDPRAVAISRTPARVPQALQCFAATALGSLLADGKVRERALGEVLSEPKAGTWFERGSAPAAGDIVLDRRTRMLYDDRHVFVNGESYRVRGRDVTLLRRLADARALDAASVARASATASALLVEWAEAGWLRAWSEVEEQR